MSHLTDTDAERAVLGCIMKDPKAMDTVTPILDHPFAFSDKQHTLIYRAAMELYGAGKPTDLTSVSSQLKHMGEFKNAGQDSFLTDLVEGILAGISSTIHVQHYAEVVKDKYTRRRIVEISSEFARSAEMEDNLSSKSLLDRWQQAAFEVGQGLSGNGLQFLSTDNDAWEQRVNQFQTGNAYMNRIMTGFSTLDRALKGFGGRELVVVAGDTGSGKTQFALQVLYDVAMIQKRAAAIVSLEMGIEEINARIQCFAARVDYSESVKEVNGLSMEQLDRLVKASTNTRSAKILVDQSPLVTPQVLLAHLRKLKSQHDLKLLVVDYLQLMEPDSKDDSRERVVSGIARSLKRIAVELDITVVTLSQITPAVTGGVGSLRESRAIGHHADTVLYLTQEDGDHGIVGHVIIKKQRSGISGKKIPMIFKCGHWFEEDSFHNYVELYRRGA